MDLDLSQRIGRALSRHPVTASERDQLVDAAEAATTVRDLPASIRRLLDDIEARSWPGTIHRPR